MSDKKDKTGLKIAALVVAFVAVVVAVVVGIAKVDDGKIEVKVHPMLIPNHHPLLDCIFKNIFRISQSYFS